MRRIANSLIWLVTLPLSLAWRMLGWEVVGGLPEDESKFIIVGGPHTSNWDYMILLALAGHLGKRPWTLVKLEAVQGLAGTLVRWLGGIPIDRTKSSQTVDQVAAFIQQRDRIILVLAPEGTRKKTDRWRSGFYHIAVAAGVPIVMGVLDYAHRRVTFSPPLYPSGDIDSDMDTIRDFFQQAGAHGKFPDQAGDIRFSSE